MRPVIAEIALSVAASTVVAAVALVLGTTLAQPPVTLGDGTTVENQGCLEAPLTAVSESGVEGVARLCIDRERVRTALRLGGLHDGEVYTAWLAYFERPAACFHTPCGFIDLRGAEPVGVLGRIDGAVAGASRGLDLRAGFRDLRASPGAQITLLVLHHGLGGDQGGRARARQLLTPQMFDLGAPLAGPIGDPARSRLHAQAIFTVE